MTKSEFVTIGTEDQYVKLESVAIECVSRAWRVWGRDVCGDAVAIDRNIRRAAINAVADETGVSGLTAMSIVCGLECRLWDYTDEDSLVVDWSQIGLLA